MTSKNDITGDPILTKISSDNKKYADNWETIFGKGKKQEELQPIKNDGPPLPNGLARHWEEKVDKDGE
jgi:hypothetical protein